MGDDVEGVEFEFGCDGVEVAETGAAMGADFEEFGRGGGGGGAVVEVGTDEAVEAVHLEVGAEACFEEIRDGEVVGFLEGGGGDADHGKLGELRLVRVGAQGVKSGKGVTCAVDWVGSGWGRF